MSGRRMHQARSPIPRLNRAALRRGAFPRQFKETPAAGAGGGLRSARCRSMQSSGLGKAGIHMGLRVAIGLLCIVFFLPATALAEKRVALVIGNGAYTRVAKLENPKNDAAAMEAMFKAAGFDTVVRANDLGAAAM